MSRAASVSLRVGIGLMVLDHVQNGVWALASARNYYESLPGADASHATAALNQVLVRDLGAARLTLAVVLVIAALWLDRRVVIAALAAATVSGLVRLVNHGLGDTPEATLNWIGYSAAVAIPIALLVVVLLRAPRAAPHEAVTTAHLGAGGDRPDMISGINHLTWSVADIEETFSFYVDVLGLTPVMKSEWSAYFLAGDVWIAVVKGEHRKDSRYDHVAFRVDEADYRALVASLERHGVSQWKVNESEGASFYFLDPSGNRFEVHSSDLEARVRDGKANWGDAVTWYV
jgi:catechol 2,3-dioxygenase-like lactoylglutathione lyase family enzyme